jgi:hypothetical protein
MKIVVRLGPRGLLRDARTELDMGAHRLPEWLVVRQARLVMTSTVRRRADQQVKSPSKWARSEAFVAKRRDA